MLIVSATGEVWGLTGFFADAKQPTPKSWQEKKLRWMSMPAVLAMSTQT